MSLRSGQITIDINGREYQFAKRQRRFFATTASVHCKQTITIAVS